MAMTYKKAGVDIEAGDALVGWLTQKSEHIGGFAALFDADFRHMKHPTLVTCTDGVGTKVLLASEFESWKGVGQDLVAMCVNDLICTGGRPLFFLDYYACGKLDLKQAKQFLSGVRNACEKSNCALIGGETAEMPGVYAKNHFDCAGFAVGVVDKPKAIGKHLVKKDDVLVGFTSSGFHSNGYSLLRKVFKKDLKKWSKTLLKPTRLYVELYAELVKNNVELHALAHITGGGLDNIGRVLPDGLGADLKAWNLPKEFLEVKKRTKMSWDDLAITLNCGIGLVAVLPKKDADKAIETAKSLSIKAFHIGELKNMSSDKKWQMDFSKWEKQNDR